MPIANKLRTVSGVEDPKIYELFSVDAYKGEDTTPKLLLHEDLDIAGNPTTIWTKKNNDPNTTQFVVNSPNIMGYSQYLDLGDTGGSQTDAMIDDIPSTGGIRFKGSSTGKLNFNNTAYTYTSYAFREHPKFFSEVSYIGTQANKTISHGLEDNLGMAIFKNRVSGHWMVWHKWIDTFQSSGTPYYKIAYLNSSYAPESASIGSVRHWGGNAVNGTKDDSAGTFTIGNGTSSTGSSYLKINVSGQSHIAWFFPDNEYVKVGRYDTQGLNFSNYGYQVDLGFEPQFLLIKNQKMGGDWKIWDRHGACVFGSDDYHLVVNRFSSFNGSFRPTPKVQDQQIFFNARGFSIKQGTNDFDSWNTDASFIYMAIRKDDEPRPADNLQKRIFGYSSNVSSTAFNADGVAFPHQYINNFKPDFGFVTKADDGYNSKSMVGNKLGQNYIPLNSALTGLNLNDFSDRSVWWRKKGFGHDFSSPYNPFMYMWKCTKGVCDHQVYNNNYNPTGNTYTVRHNLGAVPELMIFRRLVSGSNDPIYLYHKDISQDGTYLDKLDGNTLTISNYNSGQSLNNYNPTDTQFQVKNIGSNGALGHTNTYYYVWLFASYPKVSKIGSVDVNTSSVVYFGNSFPASCKLFIMWRKIKDTSGNFVQSVWKTSSTDRGINFSGGTADRAVTLVDANNEHSNVDYFNVDSSSGEAKIGFTISPLVEGAGTYAYMVFAYTD